MPSTHAIPTSPQGDAGSETLVDLAARLVREFDEVPAGSVLRCLARAVEGSRSWGCPDEYLGATAEATTRWLLSQRRGPSN